MITPLSYSNLYVTLDLTGQPRPYAIRPHADAPLFSPEGISLADYPTTIKNRITEHLSTGIQSERLLDFMKQFSLVNLFFFEKFILGPFGPWDKLTDTLHLDMCNWCQSDATLGRSAKSALALGRGHFKSTVRTPGLGTWLIVRNPDIKICIISSVFTFASRFLRDIRTVFEQNSLIGLFWPKLMYDGKTVWNDTVFFTPGRTKAGSDGTVTARGIGGASASQHFDMIFIDDPVTIEDLDKDSHGNANMDAKKQWLRSAILPLLVSPEESQIMYTFTFYAPDDFYMTDIVPFVKHLDGYTDTDFIIENTSGDYSMYWRPTPQDDEAIFPEVISLQTLQKMMEENPWMYQTQYKNWPINMDSSELKDRPIKEALLYWPDDEGEEPLILVYGEHEEDNRPNKYLLKMCDLLLVVDWSATKKGRDSKKSKTAIELWCKTPSGMNVCIDGFIGKITVPEAFDKIFAYMRKYAYYARAAVVETNAMQLGVAQLLRERMTSEGFFFSLIEDNVRGDKEARIKVNFGSPLIQGKIACTDELRKKLVEEKNIFGSVTGMFDGLDAAEKACRYLIKPENKEDYIATRNAQMVSYDGHEYIDEDELSEWEQEALDRERMKKGSVIMNAVKTFFQPRA